MMQTHRDPRELAERVRHHQSQVHALRQEIRGAQTRARTTGFRLPRERYDQLWAALRKQEALLATAMAEMTLIERSEAERFMMAARALLKPETLRGIEAAIASGTG